MMAVCDSREVNSSEKELENVISHSSNNDQGRARRLMPSLLPMVVQNRCPLWMSWMLCDDVQPHSASDGAAGPCDSLSLLSRTFCHALQGLWVLG